MWPEQPTPTPWTGSDDFELGRFVPLRADPDTDVWTWEGWARFDELLTEGG
ncbi:hypothetical protein [Streptomyces sp. NPDC054866]